MSTRPISPTAAANFRGLPDVIKNAYSDRSVSNIKRLRQGESPEGILWVSITWAASSQRLHDTETHTWRYLGSGRNWTWTRVK